MLTRDSSAPIPITSSVTTVTPVDIKKVYGLEQAPSVVRTETKSDMQELIHLGESTLSYDAELKMIGELSQKGSLSTQFVPKAFPTVIELTFPGESEPMKLCLSSPVEERMCKFQISRKRARIFCQLPKASFGLVGEVGIQHLAVLDIDTFSPWKRCPSDLNFFLGTMFSTKSSMAMKKKIGTEWTSGKDPFFDLQETIQSVILQYVEYGQERNVFKVVDPSVNKTEADITIVVQGVYKYKSMPLVKVLFTDHAVAWDLVTRKPSMQQSIFQKYVEVIQAAGMKESGPIILATKQEQVLLKRLLYTNALRSKQTDNLSPVWTQSFLHPRYPRETSGMNISEAMKEKQDMEEAMRLLEVPQQLPVVVDSSGASFSGDRNLADQSCKKCASCHKVSDEAKKCSGCSEVYYCNTQCQRNHWKIHRSVCKWKKS